MRFLRSALAPCSSSLCSTVKSSLCFFSVFLSSPLTKPQPLKAFRFSSLSRYLSKFLSLLSRHLPFSLRSFLSFSFAQVAAVKNLSFLFCCSLSLFPYAPLSISLFRLLLSLVSSHFCRCYKNLFPLRS